ncbi:MAG: enoyl-CoA hydratase/isomerase family protein [Proteobacteria bacterium]|nr:enoyl-CoA hydratase/isomerase family protein [Pseudomonadota bacterium]
MNDPRRLNGWTAPMLEALTEAFAAAASDANTGALILTGTDPYYCAGVNLGGALKLGHPRDLHAMIVEHNQSLFEMFLNFPKPLLIAVNGPAIGACVTSATLCDGIVASEKATFSTPFSALGVAAEGCSSVHFARLMNDTHAQRMLGPEGFRPTGTEAVEMGLAQWVVPHDGLMAKAQEIAAGWAAVGKKREFRAGATLDELLEINRRESVQVADSFLSRPFLKGQFRFLWSKKKRGPALTFMMLWLSQPAWSRLR